jgi:hypothetical protein
MDEDLSIGGNYGRGESCHGQRGGGRHLRKSLMRGEAGAGRNGFVWGRREEFPLFSHVLHNGEERKLHACGKLLLPSRVAFAVCMQNIPSPLLLWPVVQTKESSEILNHYSESMVEDRKNHKKL